MNTQTRFINRMGDHVRSGAEYGCAIHEYKRRMPASEKALYAVSVFSMFVVAILIILE